MKDLLHWITHHPTAVRYITVAFLFIVTLVLISVAQRLLYRFFYHTHHENAIDPTGFWLIKNVVRFTILFIFVLITLRMLPGLEKLGATLLASAGVVTVIIGLATQQAFTNIISGLFLIIYKPFRVGDTVWFSDTMQGSVEKLTLRHVVLRDQTNKRVFIPNSVASAQAVTNASITDEKVRLTLTLGISDQSDLSLAIQLIQRMASQHPNFIDPRSESEKRTSPSAVVVQVTGISGHVVQLQALVWCRLSSLTDAMRSDLLLSIREAFQQQSIEIV